MDILKIHFPKDPLANSVMSIVYYEGYKAEHAVERLLPDGTLNIVMELGDHPQFIFDNLDLTTKRKYTRSWVSGMQSEFITISSAQHTAMMVIQFKPNGAYPILGIPLCELNNLVLDGDLVFGVEINSLREGILATKDVDAKILCAEKWLLTKIRKTESIPEAVVQYAIEETFRNPHSANMKAISDKTGYSQQHFINLFKKHVGLSPKQHQRIVRFNKILIEIEKTQSVDWARLSIDYGYFDQAHFIKDFKKFSGFSPQKYLFEKGEFINYVPIR